MKSFRCLAWQILQAKHQEDCYVTSIDRLWNQAWNSDWLQLGFLLRTNSAWKIKTKEGFYIYRQDMELSMTRLQFPTGFFANKFIQELKTPVGIHKYPELASALSGLTLTGHSRSIDQRPYRPLTNLAESWHNNILSSFFRKDFEFISSGGSLQDCTNCTLTRLHRNVASDMSRWRFSWI